MISWSSSDPPFPLTLPIKIRNIEIDGGVVRVGRLFGGDWERPFSWFSYIPITETEFSSMKPSYSVKLTGPGSISWGDPRWVQLVNLLKGQDVRLREFRSISDADRFAAELSRLMKLPIQRRRIPITPLRGGL